MRYAHTNIIARNWRKLADFYINVFDCKEKPPERDLYGDWIDEAVGMKNIRIRGMHLSLPGYDEKGPTLEIFSYNNMEKTSPLQPNMTGFSHIAFEVGDVAAVFQKAMDNGGEALGKIVEKEVEGAGLLTFAYFRDPEGNIVEIQSWK